MMVLVMLKKIREHKLYIPVMWALLFVSIVTLFSLYSDKLPTQGKIIEPTVKSSANIFMSIYSMQNEYSK